MSRDNDQAQDSPLLHDRNEDMPLDLSMKPQLKVDSSKYPPTSQTQQELQDKETVYTREDHGTAPAAGSGQTQLIDLSSGGSYRLRYTISRSQSVQTDDHRSEDISHTTIGMSGGVNIGGTVIGKNVIQTDGCQNIQNLYDSSAQLIYHADTTEYVSTYAERSALRNLKQMHSIFIKGRSGSGKSRLGLRLLAEMQTQKDRIPVVLSAPAQWDLIPKTQGKYTILIDDIFGSSNLVQSKVDDWTACFEVMWPSVESGCVFIVTTSRPDIVAHCQNRLRKYNIMKNILDIDEGKYQLKVREKIKFLRKICGDNIFSKQDLDKISRLTTTLGFPQCCRFYASSIKAQSKGAAFFENPQEYILHDVSTMQESDGVAYLSLILVLMKNNSLAGKDLTDTKSNIIERCQQYCRNLPQRITASDIKHKLDSLCGVYLNKQGNSYIFQHQSIYDAVFISISREWPHEFMALCPSHILLEFVRTSRSEDNTSDWVVYINAEDYEVLAEKVTQLLLSNDPTELIIINHPCLKEDDFASYLVGLWERQKCVVTIISQYVDLDFPKAELLGIENIVYFGQCRCLGSLMVRKRQQTLVMSCVSKHKFSVKILQDMLTSAIYVSDNILARKLLDMEASPNNLCLRALSVSGDIAGDITDRIFNLAKTSQTQNTTESDDISQSSQNNDGYQSETSSDQGSDNQDILYFNVLLPDAVLNGNSHLVDLILDNFDDFGTNYSEEWYSEESFLGEFELRLRDIFEEMLYSTERQKYMTEETTVILKRLISLHDGDFHDADYLMWLAAGHPDARILKVMLQMDVNIWAEKERSENFFHCLVYNPSDLLTFPYCSSWPTALEQAVTHGGPDCLQEILKHIGQPNEGRASSNSHSDTNAPPRMENYVPLKCDMPNRYLLHIAAERRDVEKMRMLISAGMAVDIKDYKGNTPLHIAVQCGSLPCVQLLVQANADVSATNSDEMTPLLCIKLQTTISNLRKKPTEYSNVEIVKCLVESASDVNHADKEGHTPLLVAVKYNDLSSVRVLIKNHADVNYNNITHCYIRKPCLDSAIHVACHHSDVEIVKFLCEHGAKVDMKDIYEETVLHKAAGSDIDPMEKLQYLTDVQHVFLHSIDKFGRTALFNAVRSGDEEIVEFLINKEMNINHTDGSMCSVFIHACQTSNSSVICLLSERGADMSVQDKMGNTALHCVVDAGNTESTKFLLEMNADPRSQNVNGKSAVHLAAERRRSDIIKLLLDKGGDPCAPDNEGKTALQYALLAKDSECIRLLLQKGDDKCMQGEEGEMALYEEIEKGNSECIKLIIEKGADAHVQDKDGKTLLHHAARHSKDSIQALLEKGVDPLIKDKMGRTVLHDALVNIFANDYIKLLIDSGVDPNAKDVDGMTALQYAVQHNFFSLQLLVQEGADPYVQDKEGKTIMDHVLDEFTSDTVVTQFLECIDPSIKDHEGKTSLHYAAMTEHIETVGVILSKTPDPCVRDENNMSALHYAAKYSQVSNMKLFLEKGVDPSTQNKKGKTALHYAAKGYDPMCARLLLKNGLDPYVQDNKGKTPLHHAAKTHCGYNVYLFLEHMLHVNTQDKEGKTALHYAATFGSHDSITYLVGKGADPQIQDKQGKTALHYAATVHKFKATHKRSCDSVGFLLEAGADLSTRDHLGKTALHYAAEKGRYSNIKTLLERGAAQHTRDNQGMTPLHYAAKIHCSDAISYGYQQDPKARWGRTAFCQGAMKAKSTVTMLLLKTRVYNSHNNNILGCVETDCIQLLLEKGNYTYIRDIKGRTALHYACVDSGDMRGARDTVGLLLEHVSDPCIQDKEGTTALHVASASGTSKIVKLLLDSGASPCEMDIDKRTPLHYAVTKGDTESIKLLLEHGADPCIKDKDSMTALHFGAEILDSDSLELLLRNGAVPWAQDNMGRTALHYAAAVGKIENIQLLREKGTDPYTRDNRGWTPLQYAQHTGFCETIEELMNTGALAVQRSRLQLYDLDYYNPCDENQNLHLTSEPMVIPHSAYTKIRINW